MSVMRPFLVLAASIGIACASSSPAPLPPPDPQSPLAEFSFLPAKQLPVTLQYLLDRERVVACQLTDAGIPGVEGDFVVACTPDEHEWCLGDTYFGSYASADELWRTSGCYLARGDDLWWFKTCPTTANAVLDPAAGGAIKDFAPSDDPDLEAVPIMMGGDDVRDFRAEVAGTLVDVTCTSGLANGMMKEVTGETCLSPAYGPVSTTGRSIEMEQLSCRGEGHLVAVEPGLQAPRTCIAEPGNVGSYRFTTRVYQAKDKKAIGTTGSYTLDVAMGDGCKLTATIAKRGIDKNVFADNAIQRGQGPLVAGCKSIELGTNCWTLRVELADAGGKGFDAVYEIGFGAEVRGVWRYDGDDQERTGFVGLLEGAKGAGERVPFEREKMPLGLRCEAAYCRGVDWMGEYVLCDDGRWDECLHCPANDPDATCAPKP